MRKSAKNRLLPRPDPDAPDAASTRFPTETGRGGAATAFLLTLALLLAPALGVPREEMLQDTLKSIVVAGFTLAAALLFFWEQRDRRAPLRWHALMWLPLALMAYALGSTVWSHSYLGAVEAIRWFIFALLLWLGLNTLTRGRVLVLAWGIHWGAVIASLWAALQFWVDWQFFPQGPNPASTFINRNFFAEFAVCTLPFSLLLLTRARRPVPIGLLATRTGLVIVAVLMTGTRSALIALWLQLLLVLLLVLWRFRRPEFVRRNNRCRLLAPVLLLVTVIGLGLLPTGNPKVLQEQRGSTALERGLLRTRSIAPGDESLGIRMTMWKATLRMIEAHPFSGVGAGAWEVAIPLYQADGTQLETDFYAHNEFLQLVAEYGALGWLFLAGLWAYLIDAAWRTVRGHSARARAEGPLRAVALTSLLALFIVSNVGFPWRMAATGALFAACLAVLAASDARLGVLGPAAALRLPWSPVLSRAAAAVTAGCLVLAIYITQQAALAEWSLVRATKLALAISASGNPGDPRFKPVRAEVVRLMRQGIAINPHYRKLTPVVADELARWGDWANATWIWESVLESRPNVAALMTNVASGYGNTGQWAKARLYLDRAKLLQPHAPAVRTLEMVMLHQTGEPARALALARAAVLAGTNDIDLLNTAFQLAWRGADYPLAARAMAFRMAAAPQSRVDGYLQLGAMYSQAGDPERALAAFRQALALTPANLRSALRPQIPPELWERLELAAGTPARSAQRSVISR
jgi:O-antigen ligase